MKFKKVGKHSLSMPKRAHATDAGMDLQAVDSFIIRPGDVTLISTGWAVHLDPGTVGFITPRSGLSFKTSLRIANAPGTIDAGYRGELKVLMENIGINFATIHAQDRIAQLVILPVIVLDSEEVFEDSDTERGSKGFGSSGK